MKSKFSLWLIIGFLGVQLFSFLHGAEHGFAEHKHDGHACQIYFYAEQLNNTDLASAASADAFPLMPAQALAFAADFIHPAFSHSFAARAPPHFS